jgi:hypothetical protein
MNKLYLLFSFFILAFTVNGLRAQSMIDLAKSFGILSSYYSVPDNDQKNFGSVNFRYGWTKQAPFIIAVQLTNPGYADVKLKFAVKDVTTNQMVVLDPVHNSRFGTETLKANSTGAVWSGPVDSLLDSFSLRVWDDNGDEFDQAPISILNDWIVNSKPIAVVTPPAAIENTATTTTASVEKTLLTPTTTQTPVSTFTCTFAAIGDSYTQGDGASCPASIFAKAVEDTMKTWYPGISYEFDIGTGATPGAWKYGVPVDMAKYAQKGIPVAYAYFQSGPSCFFQVNRGDRPECCKGATPSQAVSYSYAYKKNMDEVIGDFYAANPDINLVVLTTPDSTAGAGTYVPTAVYQLYRQRLYELKDKYPRMRIADICNAMAGHIEYFKPTGDNDHPNDRGQVVIARTILEQFKNWPYRPTHHSK